MPRGVYFDKHAAELSPGEAALLAVIPRGPSFYDPYRQPARVATRRRHILELMEKHGHLSADDRALAERSPIQLATLSASFRAPHFVELVKERLPAAFAHGAAVRTTLDSDLQQRLEVALRAHVRHLAPRHVDEAAVVVLRNSDGAILALVGSKDYAAHAFNGVTARLRPGSTLKPFVYGAAFEAGDTPATVADDVVVAEDAHQAYTKDVKSHGFARYRESLAGSFNLSAVHTLQRVGIGTVLHKLAHGRRDHARSSPTRATTGGLAVGNAEVRLLDLTAAFTNFGRGGVAVAPRAIDLARARPTARPGPSPSSSGRACSARRSPISWFDILSDPDARKPMFGDRVPLNLPFPIALKTGTTKAYTDLWAIGVTREFTVGVWAGQLRRLADLPRDVDGGRERRSCAPPTWRSRRATAIRRRPRAPTPWSRPDICPVSGKLPGPVLRAPQARAVRRRATRRPRRATGISSCAACRRSSTPDAVRAWARFYGPRRAAGVRRAP